MGNFCSNATSRRQRAADRDAYNNTTPTLGAAVASPIPGSPLRRGRPHLTVRQHLDGSPLPSGGKNSVFRFVESPTERSGTMDDDDDNNEDDDIDDDDDLDPDDPGMDNDVDDDEKETIEFHGRAQQRNTALSTKRKLQIERMIVEEEGDNAAVLRRILAQQQQHPINEDPPPARSGRSSKPTTPPSVVVNDPANSAKGGQTKKKRFGFPNKKKNSKSKSLNNNDPTQNAASREQAEPQFITLVESVQTRVIHEEENSSENPSDEENITSTTTVSPSIPKGIVQRRTTQLFTSHGVSPGPLTSIRLKTQSTASPESITIRSTLAPHSGSSCSTSTTGTQRTVPSVTAKGNRIHETHGGPKAKKSTAAVEDHQYSEFQKLQLKAAVAKKKSQRQQKVAKVEDRLKDVQGYRELWESFAQIQETVETTTLATGQVVVPVDAQGTVQPVAVSAAESKSPTPCDDHPDMGSTEVVEDYDLEDPISSKQPSIEYDLAEDLGFMKSSGSSIASSIRSLTSRKSSRTHGSTGGGSSRRRRRFRRHSQKIESESAVIVPGSTTADDSFSLKEAQKWYFDFQDEFEINNNINNNGPEVGRDHDTTGSNSSQASLSLLSQNSLEAQRRFFAEKRRQRKLKEKQHKNVPFVVTPSNHTKNGIAAGYGITAVNNKIPVGGDSGQQIELDETPIAGNLRRDSTGVPNMGLRPAQQLLESKDNPALRLQIAANILKSRSLTNMEVTFSTPESDVVADDASMVSDLDDNMSVTSNLGHSANDYGVRRRPSMNSSSSVNNRSVSSLSKSHRHHHHNRYDYGVQRRQRRGMTSQSSSVVSHDGDRSSIGGSDFSESHSEIRASAYDHEMVLKRRLEIEARLRALKAEDEEENVQELPDTAQLLSEQDTLQPSPSSQEYTLPAVLSPKDVRSQRKRGKSSDEVYSAVACNYLGSPMLSGKVSISPMEPIHSNAQNTPPDGTTDYPIASADNVMSPAAKRISPSSKAAVMALDSSDGVSQKTSSKLSRFNRKEHPHQLSPIKLGDSFESSVNSRPCISLPYLNAARASSSKRRTVVSPDDNDSLVTSSVVSLSSTAPSSASGKDQAEAAVYETGGSSSGRGLDGARETLLLADQVEAHVKDVLNRYRSAPEIVTPCSDDDDDQPPRIVSSRGSWIR